MFSVQLGAALSTPLFASLGPAGTAWLRLGWAAALLLVWTRPRLRGRTPGDLGAALALGAASAGLTVCFFEAIARIPLGAATTIEFLGPIGVAVAASRRPADLAWTACAALGVVLLGGASGDGLDRAGLGFALVAALCWAAYIVLTKRVGARFPGTTGLAVSLTVAAVAVAPLGAGEAVDGLSPRTLAATAGLAVLLPLLPYVLELRALRRMDARAFSVLMSLEPAIGSVAGWVVLGQSLAVVQYAGIAAVVVASGAVSIRRRPAREPVRSSPVSSPVG
jgi:inner membrane transporter RhtA